MRSPHRSRVTAILLLLGLCRVSAYGTESLLDRVPAGSNAAVSVDVDSFMSSPLARQQNWGENEAGPPPRSPSPLPPVSGMTRFVLAARVNTVTAEPVWQVSVMEFAKPFATGAVAQRVSGYVDVVANKPLVRTRGEVYILELDNRTLAAAHLADRQFVSRWMRESATRAGAATSAFLREAVEQVAPKTPIVMALDLEDAVSERAVRRTLQRDPPAALKGASVDAGFLAATLASLRGIVVKVAVEAEATGTATFSFGRDTAPLAEIAGPLILETIASYGLDIPDLQRWKFAAAGNTVTGTGPLSPEGLHRLMTLLQPTGTAGRPPRKIASAIPAADTAPAADPASLHSRAVASQKYFKDVSTILYANKPGPSLADNAGWLTRDARRIEQLPITDVDPDLVDWGVQTSALLVQAAAICASGQEAVRSQTVSVDNPYVNSTSDDGGAERDRQVKASQEAARQDTRKATSAVRAEVSQRASKPLRDALNARNAIRKTMVSRYMVDF